MHMGKIGSCSLKAVSKIDFQVLLVGEKTNKLTQNKINKKHVENKMVKMDLI